MKKLLLVLLMSAFFFAAVPVYAAEERMQASGEKTADALVYIGPGMFYGIAIATDGTNDCTISIYDNTTNTGKLIVPTFVATTGASDRTKSFFVYPAIEYTKGVYVDITLGGGTVGYEIYRKRQ